MSEEDLVKIKEACRPVAYMVFGGVPPSSPQDNANAAWAELGARMGFDYMTVQPDRRGARFFTAVPSETPEQCMEREKSEEAEKKRLEIGKLKAEIATRVARLSELEGVFAERLRYATPDQTGQDAASDRTPALASAGQV